MLFRSTSASTHASHSISTEVPEHLRELFHATVEDNHLPQTIMTDLKDLFIDHMNTSATGPTDIGFCDILEHDIDTGDHHPIKQSPRRPPFSARQAEDDILDEMIQTGVIEPSESPWASPVCLEIQKVR